MNIRPTHVLIDEMSQIVASGSLDHVVSHINDINCRANINSKLITIDSRGDLWLGRQPIPVGTLIDGSISMNIPMMYSEEFHTDPTCASSYHILDISKAPRAKWFVVYRHPCKCEGRLYPGSNTYYACPSGVDPITHTITLCESLGIKMPDSIGESVQKPLDIDLSNQAPKSGSRIRRQTTDILNSLAWTNYDGRYFYLEF